jgi:hypothetical protein
MNAIPVLTIDDVATLDGVLADFLKKAEAELTVVIDRGGNVISQYGDMTVMDVTIIAALAAGSFAATRELARRIGEVEFNFAMLDAVKKSIPEPVRNKEIISDLGIQTHRIEIDANYIDVFQIIMDPELRQLAGGGGMKETITDSPVPHIGAKHICVADDFNLEVEYIGFTQTEKELTLTETQRIPLSGFEEMISSQIRLVAPMTLVGFTALSEEIKTKLLQPASAAKSKSPISPRTLFFTAS